LRGEGDFFLRRVRWVKATSNPQKTQPPKTTRESEGTSTERRRSRILKMGPKASRSIRNGSLKLSQSHIG